MTRGLLLAGVLAAFAGCGGDDAPASGGRPGERPPAPVTTTAVEHGTLAREIEVSGVVEPLRQVTVTSQLGSTVDAVLAEEGDRVGRGTVLARLDDAELALELESARAAREAAVAAFERAERLREREVITLPEFERDRTALAAAEAAYRRLQTRVGYATVASPIAGVVTEKNVEAGDVVAPQQALFRVADVSTLVVLVGVSELDVGQLAAGDLVDVALDAAPGVPRTGRIRRVFPSADPTTRLVPVEVALEPGSGARPGYLARVRLRLEEREGVAIVPAGAVVSGAGGEAAFVVAGGVAERREIETGLVSAGRVEVVSGLEPGEIVVVDGAASLRDGAPVRPVESRRPPAADASAGSGGS